MRRVQRLRDDHGMVLVLAAVAMLALLAVAAMAVDLGAKRASRRSDQSVADLAAVAAGSFLAGNGGPVVASNPFLACKGALTSALANIPAFAPTQDPDTTCGTFPTDARAGCSPTTAPSEAVFSDARFTLRVRYPIPASELTSSRFSGGVGVDDGTDRCERMRVTFGRVSPTTFARVLGVDQQATEATSVIRATTGQLGQGIAALLLLERVGCAALQNSGQGAVVVQSPTAANPGVIQADSAGQLPACTTNANASGYVIYGTALPSASGGGPSIVAETSSNGTTGIIGTYSTGIFGARGAAVYPGGLSVAPVRSSIASRQPVDDKYNGSGSQISDLHATAWSTTGWTTATATSNGYSVMTQCNGSGVPGAVLAATRVFVSCPGGLTLNNAALLFPNATHLVINGALDIRNNGVLSLPAAQRVYVRGAVSVQGKLLVNTGETSLATPDAFANGVACSSRRGPGAGGTTTNTAQLATFNGAFQVTGQLRLCQTALYMGRATSTYTRQTVTGTGLPPENYPALAQCAPTLPCPKDGVDTSWPFSISGGGATSDWSAPNQLDHQPDAAELVTHPFEDLAFWGETSSTGVALKGQAGNLSEGVFFFPNASVVFTGQGSQPIVLNAQFLTRALNMSGQGSLTLSPSPADAVITPIPGAAALIR